MFRARQGRRIVVVEAVVARLDRMAQPDAVERLGKQVDEPRDIVAVEFAARGELPQDRPELVAQHGKALGEEIADAFRPFAQVRAHHAEARALDRELEAVGDRLSPGFPAFRALAAVEGGVDLDRAELARRIFELLPLRQLVGVEFSAPRRVGPAANADADLWARSHRHQRLAAIRMPWARAPA